MKNAGDRKGESWAVRGALFMLVPLLIGAAPASSPGPVRGDTSVAVPPVTPPVTDAPAGVTLEGTPVIQAFDLDATRRMSVPVTVGGEGPFYFLVDTGAERTVIARELAERLGLVDGAKLRMATIGSSVTVPSFQVASLELTNMRIGPIEAPAVAGRHIGAAGLIGVDMLAERRILIDFRKERMQILETRYRARPIIRDDDAIVVTARNSAGRLILSDARIDGRRIDLIVDTGAQTSVGNLAMMKLVAARRQNKFPFVATTLGAVTGETVPAMRTVVERIAIGGIDVNGLPVSFTDARAFRALNLHERPALLLGMDSLSLFDRIEIDFPNKRVVFDMPEEARRATGRRLAKAGSDNGG